MIGEDDVRCTYEPGQRSPRISANALSVSRHRASRSRGARLLPFRTSIDGSPPSEPLESPSSDGPLITCQNPSEFASSLPPPQALAPCEQPPTSPPRVHNGVVLRPSSDVSAARHIHATTEYLPRSTVSSFTVLPSIHFRTIPRPLRVPLSLIPPERVQVSSVAEGDLDMTLYVFPRSRQSRGLNHHTLAA